MAQPLAESAFGPHREAMAKALEEPNGVAVTLKSRREAVNFRHQCHTLRSRSRSRMARELGPERAHGATTIWDELTFGLVPGKDGNWEIHIKKIVMPEIKAL